MAETARVDGEVMPPAGLVGWSRRGQQASRPPAEVAEVHATSVGRSCQTRGEVQCLVELRPGDGRLLAHVAKDGDLGPRGDQRVGDPIDPDAGAAPVPALVAGDPLESE